ncbi:MAG: hypothetical protein IJO43_00720 [Bacilli bacterium]|nr:hypothetical protein [Bacilli bacterium]
METNKYHALCSNEILKIISSLVSDDSNITSLSTDYDSLFKADDPINFIWPMISTSLLTSENLYKYDKSYKLISESTIKLIVDKLYMYPLVLPNDRFIGPSLLDAENNIASSFLNYINYDVVEARHNSYRYGKYIFEEDFERDLVEDDLKDTLNRLRKDSSYGCNDSIIEDGFINLRKFIGMTRNALAHSNYEAIDENYIRLYHYNTSTKRLDFNVILEPSIIVLMVDELNEIASNKYSNFMEVYRDPASSELLEEKITDERIIEYMLSFDMFDEDIALSILNEIRNKEAFLNASTEEDKVMVIIQTIYERIKPIYDTGIILNDYLYSDEDGRILSDELYDKYGLFDYLNSKYYSISESDTNDIVYKQNKFKFLLLSLLNCSLLNSYNVTEGKELDVIDFSKMIIDKEIFGKFLVKNGRKTLEIISSFESQIEKNKREWKQTSKLIGKKRDILMKLGIDNDYFNIVLPSELEELGRKRMEISASSISMALEVDKAKRQGHMYNFDKNFSHFVFNHLRNSLAHGYVKFPSSIDLSNVSDMIITFEDYNPIDKKELTFRGTIKLGELLTVITSNTYVNGVLGMNDDKNGGSLVKK